MANRLAQAMLCRGNFRFLDDKGQSVASTAFTSMTVSSSASLSNHTPTITSQPQIVLRNETSKGYFVLVMSDSFIFSFD